MMFLCKTSSSSLAFYLFILFCCINFTVNENHKWCWTKSMVNEPSFILNTSKGGMNWGYCLAAKKTPPLKFFAVVNTSTLEHSETSSAIKITLFGDKGKGDEVYLNQDGFERSHSKKLTFSAKDVGDLQKIRLKLEGNQPYRCKDLTIFKGPKRYKFSCLRAMSPCTPLEPKKCILDIPVDGNRHFEVTIKTGDAPNDGTKAPIGIILNGTKGPGQKNIISEKGVKSASSEKFVVHTTDIGPLTGFTLSIEGKDKWKPVKLDIVDLKTKAKKSFKLDNVHIANPGSSPYTFSGEKKSGGSGGNGGNGGSGGSGGSSVDVDNPDAGLMENQDKKDIIDITCEQTLENPDAETNWFGPDYPTKDVNYSRVLVRCPSNCHKIKNGVIYGYGIHPEKTSICLAGIVDHAISLYGGVMSISIFPAFDEYVLPTDAKTKVHNIEIKPYNSDAKKSFVLAKVDNIDLVEKDMRILNDKGQLASEGRLEMRYEGVWSTICSLGNNRRAAKVICKDIGYKDGEWKSPPGNEGKAFCKGFNGEDHCAAETSKSLFSKIVCNPSDNTFNKCNKVLADPNECSTDYNAIISCYNRNFQSEVPIPNKTIRLESIKKESTSIIGRLEMFYSGKWKPVCNIGFTPQAAVIACQQMGFKGGKIVSEKSKAQPFFLPMNSKLGFSAMNINCKGKENGLMGCKMSISNVNCKHDQDLVLECNITKTGDNTGRSQYIKKLPTPIPKLGKLAIPSRTVDCDEKGYDIKYRGDPGSIYIINCPKYCDRKRGSIWGTGVFTSDSNICKAAIYSGVIGSLGGQLALIKTFGQKKYVGKTLMGGIISADNTREWPSSFSISQMNSGWLNQNKLVASFLETSTEVQLEDKVDHFNHFNAESALESFNRIDIATSFLESGALVAFENQNPSLPTPIFKWTPPSFKHEFKPSTHIIIQKHNINSQDDYTLVFNFELTSFKNEDTYIFSYSGCGGYNIIIRKNGTLAIGDLCDNKRLFLPGYQVPLKDPVSIHVRVKGSSINFTAKSEKVKLPFTKKSLVKIDMRKEGPVGIGVLASDKNKGHFLGTMKYFFLFHGGFDLEDVPALVESIKIVGDGSASFKKTVDDRLCVSTCTDNPIPPDPKAGRPPKEAELNGNDESSGPKSNSNGKKGGDDSNGKGGDGNSNGKKPSGGKGKEDKKDNGEGDDDSKGRRDPTKTPTKDDAARENNPGDSGTYDKNQTNNIETNVLTCETNLLDKRFTGQAGKHFRVSCPNCSRVNSAMVFGTAIYHPRSSICKAALHSGAISPGSSGKIIVTLVGPKPMFNGSVGADKTNSGTFSAADKSFKVEKAEPLTKVSCTTKANEGKFAQAHINSKFVIKCPKNCSKVKGGLLFGTDTYTDNSFICLAAVHRGIINDLGGEVKFKVTSGLEHYKGSNGFGVDSKTFGAHIRSYEFLGLRSAIHYHYEEDYLGDIKKKWNIENAKIPRFPSSNQWGFVNKSDFKDAKGKPIHLIGIQHLGKIDTYGKAKFGSILTLKDKEWANGTVKFNLFLENKEPIGFFFRYKDNDNYYALKIDPKKSVGNFELISKQNGFDKINYTKGKQLFLKTWYRLRVDYNFEKVKVYIQSAEIREHKLLFDVKMKGNHRGTIGFGTKGNQNFVITGIKIMETPKSLALNPNNKRTWKKVLAEADKGHRKMYCDDLFGDDKIGINRCLSPHVFCKYKCNGAINNIENILNYHCYTDCVKVTKAEKVASPFKKAGPVNFLSYIPKFGDKCDYRPSGLKTYFACEIKGLKKLDKKKFAKIEYKVASGVAREVFVQYPNASLLECGKGLTMRTDCKKK